MTVTERAKTVRNYKDLEVFQRAMDLALNIFEMTKNFPKEEQYSLVDQMRRASRSVCANIGEAWRKRRYQKAFVSKLSDAEAEVAETQVWIEISERCGYINSQKSMELEKGAEIIISQIVRMISQPQKWSFHCEDK